MVQLIILHRRTNMAIYSEIKSNHHFPEMVMPVYRYYAYLNGTATTFDTMDEAKKHSKLVERVQINKDEVTDYQNKVKNIYSDIYNEWDAWLRNQYSDVSHEVYSLCMSMAYDRGHSSGYDEVESYLSDYIYFAKSILNTVKK